MSLQGVGSTAAVALPVSAELPEFLQQSVTAAQQKHAFDHREAQLERIFTAPWWTSSSPSGPSCSLPGFSPPPALSEKGALLRTRSPRAPCRPASPRGAAPPAELRTRAERIFFGAAWTSSSPAMAELTTEAARLARVAAADAAWLADAPEEETEAEYAHSQSPSSYWLTALAADGYDFAMAQFRQEVLQDALQKEALQKTQSR